MDSESLRSLVQQGESIDMEKPILSSSVWWWRRILQGVPSGWTSSFFSTLYGRNAA
jgi:hypothetical protein